MAEFIRVLEQRDGLRFTFVKEAFWVEKGFPKEYIVKVVVTTDVERQLERCRTAFETEGGIFFVYPDFSTGAQRQARIIDANETPDGALELEIVLDQSGYDDWNSCGRMSMM